MSLGGYFRYLSASAVLVLLCVAVMKLAVVEIAGAEKSEYLLRYQQMKVHASEDIDTVFVGDSSLGNAIDVAHFDSLAGTKSANLALTRHFGYAGSLNMLRAMKQTNPVKTVVVMHTPHMAVRDPSYVGYIRTAAFSSFEAEDFLSLQISEMFTFIQELIFYVFDIRAFYDMFDHLIETTLRGGTLEQKIAKLIKNDYVIQGNRLDPEKEGTLNHRLLKRDSEIKDAVEAQVFLRRLIEYCDRNGIRMIYVSGPIWSDYFELNRNFFERMHVWMADVLRDAYVDHQVLIDKIDLGNTINHVHPTKKIEFTERYFALLKPVLRTPKQ